MQDRSRRDIIKDIHIKHNELADLYKELEEQLVISQGTERETTPQRQVHIDGAGYLLNVGCTVEILTTGLTASKGQYATVAKLHKHKVEVRTIYEGKVTQRKPENLKWVGTGQDEHTSN